MSSLGYRHRILGLTIAVTAILAGYVNWRFEHRGEWLPNPPDQIGPWAATDMPLSRNALNLLGDAPTQSRSYLNPFKEKVEAHVIATASFDAYHEPGLMQPGHGFSLTAEKEIPLFGKDKRVRAMILKSDVEGQRVLMYAWTQYESGEVVVGRDLNDYRDIYPRLTVGMQTVLDRRQTCIVRAYTQIHPSDPLGVQARRNLNEVATGLYESFRHDSSRSSRAEN